MYAIFRNLISVARRYKLAATLNVIVEGSKDALKTPGNVLIPQSMSRKFFGVQSAVGQRLGDLTVGAVYRDFPANTILKNCIYKPLPENEGLQDWNANNYHVFIRINHPSQASLLLDNSVRRFLRCASKASIRNGYWARVGVSYAFRLFLKPCFAVLFPS